MKRAELVSEMTCTTSHSSSVVTGQLSSFECFAYFIRPIVMVIAIS